MEDIFKLFGVMMAVTMPAVIGWGIYALIANYSKRLKAGRPNVSSQELEQLRTRVEELEQGQRQVHELAERLDFVERILPTLREGKALPK
jgi:Tfp pilus assembly protein PilO